MTAPLPTPLKRGRKKSGPKPGTKYARKPGVKVGHKWGQRNLSLKNACRACAHRDCEKLNWLLAKAGGAGITPIAAQFGLSVGSVKRHWDNHVGERFKRIISAGPFVSFDNLVEKATEASSDCLDTVEMHLRLHNSRTALALETGSDQLVERASRLAHLWLRAKADLTGEILPAARNTYNVNVLMASPEFARTLAAIVDELSEFPEARQRVIERMRKLERHEAIADQRTIDVSAND